MVKTRTTGHSLEVSCPACGASILRSSQRVRKAQCPKCREIVRFDADPKDDPVPSSGAAVDIEAMRKKDVRIVELEEQIEILQGRIEALKSESSQQPVAEECSSTTFPERPSLKWLHAEGMGTIDLSDERKEVLIHNARLLSVKDIRIEADEGETAQRQAAWFRSAFNDSDGSSDDSALGPPPENLHRLIFAVGTIPMSQKAAATHLALTAAGFYLISRLDTLVDGDEAVLILE